MKLFEELYYGNINPCTKLHAKDSPFTKAAILKNEMLQKLLDSLNEQEEEILDEFLDAQSEMEETARIEKFSFGIRFGVLLMIEVFKGSDDLLPPTTLS